MAIFESLRPQDHRGMVAVSPYLLEMSNIMRLRNAVLVAKRIQGCSRNVSIGDRGRINTDA